MEAGFAAASEGEMEAIKLIANAGLRAEVYSMARGVKKDIDAVIKTGAMGVHLVIPSSDLHLQYKLKKSREEVLKITTDTTQYAKDHGLIVELSAEDATRSDLDFLTKMFKAGVAAGADRLCPCDTVGVLIPEKTSELYVELKKRFKNVHLSVHCHDDFGLAVANSIIALKHGADQAHVTMNGLGERAGNASLEEIAVVLNARYNVNLGLKTKLIYETSRLVSRITDFPMQPNKAIVGENAFSHESGIHTRGVTLAPSTFEPIKPEFVGRRRKLVAGKLAGTSGIRAELEDSGLYPNEEQLAEVVKTIKELGDKGKTVTDADLLAIARVVMGKVVKEKRIVDLTGFSVVTGIGVIPTASVRLVLDGKEYVASETGFGPVDAAIKAVQKLTSPLVNVKLKEYRIEATTGGSDAIGEVIIKVEDKDGNVVSSRAVNEDIVMASVEAMIDGINKSLLKSRNRNK